MAFLIAGFAFLLHRNVIAALMMALAVAIGAHGVFMLGEFRQEPVRAQNAKPLLRFLSFNIMGNNGPGGPRIADYIIGSGADVVFIQESAPIGPEIDRIKAVYPYRLGCGAKTITCDQSLWSKRPFLRGEVFTASPIYRDRLMLASIDFDGRVVNFANVHLTKPYFDNFHEIELAQVARRLEAYSGPMVLAGDFNASILLSDIRAFLRRTGLRTAETEPNTWPVALPLIGMAIDHVFTRGGVKIASLERIPDPIGSNHYGLISEIVWDE
ncbi:endonuclease/exonuclease/phosphatase family protein [Rhizobium sp. FKL33]|uniref:endonuclease/exonuclease/phosphatase family protein n=1 Tax=Rhizobium sp. FKL33 TaxID=2562307 RepID=UPI0010BFE9C8|nr:endonuclease/exonuclease/phosphatase family protein [Rhizobium sp. FKL33]